MISKLFLNDKYILGLIIVNTVIIFIGGYELTQQEKYLLTAADNTITLLFIIELLVKLNFHGLNKYLVSQWNRIDFVLILISLPALIIFVFNINLPDISFLLVFRVLRVFKTIRFLKFIPNINQLISGIRRALKTSVFVFLGFVIYVVIVGILSFYIFSGSGSPYFENPMISLYSTFKIFTVEGWFEIPEQIITLYSPINSFFIILYFIIVVLTGGIFGLSLVNSIFVDSMVSDNNDVLEAKIDHLNANVNELITKIKKYEIREDIG